MAGNIKGITIEIGANTTKLAKALRQANAPIKSMQGELKRVSELLKLNPGSMALVRQKTELLNRSIEQTQANLKEMKAKLNEAKAKGIDESSAGFRRMTREIEQSENKLKGLLAESGKFSVMSSKIGIATQKLATMGAKAKEVGSKLKGISAGAGVLGGFAVGIAAEFDSSMSKVQAISGATGKEFDQLREKAREMGAKTKFSATESADALSYMAMAGWKTKDMLNGIGGVMNLAAASGEDLATTSDIVTDALTAFGLSANDSGHFADILAAASSNANTNVSMMGETFKYCAPIAGALGFSAEDTANAIGLMANAGIKSSQAGTALRGWMTRMAKPTKESATAMEKLGFSLTDSAGKVKPLGQIIGELREKFSGLTSEQKAQYAAMLAGQNGMSGFLALVNASDKDVEKLSSAIANCDGAAENMAETMQNNFGGQLTILKSQLSELAISMAETLTPIMRKLVSIVQKVVGWFNNLSDSTKATVTKLLIVVAAAGPLLIAFGAVSAAIGSAVSAFANIKGAMLAFKATSGIAAGASGKLAGALAKISPVGIVAGLAAAALAVGIFVSKNENAQERIKQIFEKIKESVKVAMEKLPDILSGIGSAIMTVLPQIASTVASGLVKLAQTVGQNMPTIVQKIVGFIKTTLPLLLSAVTQIIAALTLGISQNIASIVKGAGQIAIALSAGLIQSIPIILKTVPQIIAALAKALVATGKALVQAGKQLIQYMWNGFKSRAKSFAGAVPGMLKAALTALKNSLQNGFRTAWDNVKTITSNKIQAIKSSIKSKFDNVKELIAAPFQKAKTLVSNAIGAIKRIVDAVKLKLDIKIPHIKLSGGKAPWGIGGKGSLPSFNVEWHKEGAIFTKPTLFHGVGEAGKEAVLPIEKLSGIFANTMKEYRSTGSDYMTYVEMKRAFTSALESLAPYLANGMIEAVEGMSWKVGNREFGRLVRSVK